MRGRGLLVAFGVWTLFVWATRIGTAWSQDDLSTAGRAGRVGLALSFTAFGVVLLVVAGRARGRALTGTETLLVRVAAGWTIAVWVVRGAGIALADHEAAFVVVHTVLALVSIALAVVTVRTTTMPLRHGTTGHRRREAHVTS
jgi:hypothetical protein